MALFQFNIRADRSDIRKLLSHQKFILEQLLQIRQDMAKASDEFRAAIDEIKSAADNIAADIDRLADQAEGGLNPTEATAFVDELRSVGTHLRAVADKNPETPTEPNPEEPA